MQSVIATSRGAELSKIFVKGRGARALFEGGGGAGKPQNGCYARVTCREAI